MIARLFTTIVIGLTYSLLAQGDSCGLHNGGAYEQVQEISDALRLKITPTTGGIVDPYSNPQGCWASDNAEANACTHEGWRRMEPLQKAEYIYLTIEELLVAHGLNHDPEILLCKTVQESCFRPQDQSGASWSDASGLSQVLSSTAVDLFERGHWFDPKVRGFTELIDKSDGLEYWQRMSQSPLAQLELGLAVYHQKSLDYGVTAPTDILFHYKGDPNDADGNRAYASAIDACAQCIDKNGSQITMDCLNKVESQCFSD